MTLEEAKKTLLLYRPGTADATDPELAEALALARQDGDLARWLEQHCAQQGVLREKFRQIPVPAGLREQILSERGPTGRKNISRPLATLAVVSAVFILAAVLAPALWRRPPNDDTFANYRSRMVSAALRGYAMDFTSSDLGQIRAYLARQKAVENFILPPQLQKATPQGCAIESWQGAKVAMICFRTGRPLPPGAQNDLWLFVADSSSVKNAPSENVPRLARINKLDTATWKEGDKLYLIGVFGNLRNGRGFL